MDARSCPKCPQGVAYCVKYTQYATQYNHPFLRPRYTPEADIDFCLLLDFLAARNSRFEFSRGLHAFGGARS